MSDFFTAYRARMQRNHDSLMKLADELTNIGVSVYHSKDRLVKSLWLTKDNTHLYLSFCDVPYRWELSCSIEWVRGNGSSRTIEVSRGGENVSMPYTVDYILSKMQPIPKIKAPGYGILFDKSLLHTNNTL